MKALSIQQPYANMICEGGKKIEFRSWKTDHRGELLVCSSKTGDDYWLPISQNGEVTAILLPKGTMICVVNLVDVRPMTQEDADEYGIEYDPKMYSWVLGDEVAPVYPDKVTGQVKLFDVPETAISPLDDDAEGFWEYDYEGKNTNPPKDVLATLLAQA